MAFYTYTQLYGSGSIGETFDSGVEKTFTFTNPSGSSYFTMETIPTSTGFFEASSPKNFSGSFVVSESMGLVTSSYIASVVVQPGTQSFKFTPAITVTGTTYYLRGTGGYSLDILSSAPIDPDAQAFIMEAGITSALEQGAINDLVIGLKADSLWEKMLAIYPFVGGSPTTCKYNLKNTATFELVFNGTWAFSSNGIQPNGIDTYANTNFIPSSSGWLLGSSSISAYSRTNNTDTGSLWGTKTANANTSLYPSLITGTGTNILHNTNASQNPSPVPTSSSINLITSRINTTNLIIGVNAVASSYVNTEFALSSRPIFLSARNDNGTTNLYSNRELAFAHIGTGLTIPECTLLYNQIQAFQTTLGRANP